MEYSRHGNIHEGGDERAPNGGNFAAFLDPSSRHGCNARVRGDIHASMSVEAFGFDIPYPSPMLGVASPWACDNLAGGLPVFVSATPPRQDPKGLELRSPKVDWGISAERGNML